MRQSRPTPCDPEHSTATSGAAMTYYIDAEAHARAAARLVELDPDLDAQREARILYLAAQRIRSRRLGAGR